MEGVVLALDAGVLDHGTGVGLQARHGAADVAVDFDNLFDGRGLEEGGGYTFLDAEDDAAAGCDADCGTAQLDCFEGVFDLEEAAFGGEGAGLVLDIGLTKGSRLMGRKIILRTYLMPRSVTC